MRSDRRVAFGARSAEANGGHSSVQTAGVLRPDALALRHRLYGHPAPNRGEASPERHPCAGTDRADEGLPARCAIQMEHGSVLASRTVLQDRDAGAETEVRGGRARTPHWFGRDVWKSADRTRPWRGAAATDGIRHGPRPPLRREGGFDDDQRCAGTDLGHRAIARAGWQIGRAS